jgi:hypothetical protein
MMSFSTANLQDTILPSSAPRDSIKVEPRRRPGNEFAALAFSSPDDIRKRFTHNLFFGCEADDPVSAWEAEPRRSPGSPDDAKRILAGLRFRN